MKTKKKKQRTYPHMNEKMAIKLMELVGYGECGMEQLDENSQEQKDAINDACSWLSGFVHLWRNRKRK